MRCDFNTTAKITKSVAASRAVSGALSVALIRKYSGFNLYSAVPVPTQLSAVLATYRGLEPLTSAVTGQRSTLLN